MNSKPRILIVEDEDPIRMALADALRNQDFDVVEAADGDQGFDLACQVSPDLILLDLMMPGRDGFAVLKGIREKRMTCPVIILSARGEEWDRIQGFEFGADDYMVKPFSAKELMLRIQVALRRQDGQTPGLVESDDVQTFGNVTVDFAGYCLERDGQQHGLSRKELDLLSFFLRHPGQTLERNHLLDSVWGADEFPTTRTIDTHVLKLRKKIEDQPDSPRHLLTVHGVGYKFIPNPSLTSS